MTPEPTLTINETAAVARTNVHNIRRWRKDKLFGRSVGPKHSQSKYPLDAVFRAVLLGAMNGLPFSDEAKCLIAQHAESGRALHSPHIGGHHRQESPDGSAVLTYDPTMKRAPDDDQCPRWVTFRGSERAEHGVEILVQRDGHLDRSFWDSFSVIDARALYKQATEAIGAKVALENAKMALRGVRRE